MIKVICRNSNNNIVFINGDRKSFRLRQRSRNSDGYKVKPLRFVSYKEAQKIHKKKVIYGPVTFYSVSKL